MGQGAAMGENAQDYDIEQLVRGFQASDLVEMHVRTDDFELFMSRDPQASAPWMGQAAAAPVVSAAPAPAAPRSANQAPAAVPVRTAVKVPENFVIVSAPYLGTFYRAPKPGEPNFVELGQSVEPGQDLCLVEVMKLFTAVCAEIRGVVRHVYAADGEMVSEGQLLFALEPLD